MSIREIKFRVWYLPEKKMYFRGYQKVSHVLLCDDDHGDEEGRGIPVKRASYSDCELLESTGLFDKNNHEIYEGDFIRVETANKVFEGFVEPIPDMFRSRKLNPLHGLLQKYEVPDDEEFEIEILGNRYEKKIV